MKWDDEDDPLVEAQESIKQRLAGLPMASWRGPKPVAGKFDTPPAAGAPLDDLCLVRANSQSAHGFEATDGWAVQGAPAGAAGISSHKRSDDSPTPVG